VPGATNRSKDCCCSLLTAQNQRSVQLLASEPGKALADGRRWGGFQTEISPPFGLLPHSSFFSPMVLPHPAVPPSNNLEPQQCGGSGGAEARRHSLGWEQQSRTREVQWLCPSFPLAFRMMLSKQTETGKQDEQECAVSLVTRHLSRARYDSTR